MEENSIPTENKPQTPGFTPKVEGEYVEFGPGIAGAINARQDVAFSQGMAVAVAVGRDMTFSKGSISVSAIGHDLTLSQGGGVVMNVGGSAAIAQGGAVVLNAGGGAHIEQGSGGLVITPQLTASRSRLGVVIAGKVDLSEDSRVMFSTQQAAAFGAAFGAVFGIIAWLFRRR
jgi:hypothetical protein